jgi:hypothetical protein
MIIKLDLDYTRILFVAQTIAETHIFVEFEKYIKFSEDLRTNYFIVIVFISYFIIILNEFYSYS